MGFLEDFMYKPEQKGVMDAAIGGVLDMLKASADEVDRNINLSKLLTYKRIQFQRIDITNVAYSLSSLLNNSQVISLMGIDKNTSMEKRIEIWNQMTSLEQANILDMVGYYLEFTNNVLTTITDDLKKKKFDIIDFELCDLGNNMLVRNVDYVFYDNKLMLLKEFFDDSTYKKKYLIMKNIVVDAGLTEDTLGGFLHMPSNKELTKVEYNEILKGFTEAASKGPIIGEYRTALNRYKSLDGIRVYDKLNADATRRHFWGSDDKLGEFTKFDFIVSMPVQLVYKPEKLEYIINFFNQTKPAYANFVFSPELIIIDTIPMKAKPTLIKTNGWVTLKDNIPSKTIPCFFNEHWFSEDYLLNERVSHNTVKTPTFHAFDKYEDLFEKETYIEYESILNVLDIIPRKTIVEGYIESSVIDKVQIGKGVAGDSYRLDEDYFDLQVISDPIKPLAITSTHDFIGYNDSWIDCIMPIANITDKVEYKESHSKYSTMSIGDVVKIFRPHLDYVYVADSGDYIDSVVFGDNMDFCGMLPIKSILDMVHSDESIALSSIKTIRDNISLSTLALLEMNTVLVDSIQINDISEEIILDSNLNLVEALSKTEKIAILNAKNLYDRMNNEDISSKTVSFEKIDNAHINERANIIKCDSMFDYDYPEESCMYLDTVDVGYDENIKADFNGRELIVIELIPKNI